MGRGREVVAVTMGDPSGIGPEIVVKALVETRDDSFLPVVIGDPEAISAAAAVVGAAVAVVEVDAPPPTASRSTIFVKRVSSLAPQDRQAGRPSVAGGEAVYRSIVTAATWCREGIAAAMATAPISKEVLNRAGHHYPGHTELLAELTGSADFVMMLAGPRLRVALVTIHEALAAVPALVTRERVLRTISVVHRDLARYVTPRPRLAVAALNPHCGEGGMFGAEEQTVIAPAVADARAAGIDVNGPLSADTLFHFAAGGKYDAVVCMYHDQGLIPLKLLHFDDGVNVTLGLPIIRTSVDHGTAYDLAGTGTASAASMVAALRLAAEMASMRRERVESSPSVC